MLSRQTSAFASKSRSIFKCQHFVARSYVKDANREVIVLKDFQNKLFEGDVVKVKSGYMRNYLYPQGIATYATPDNKKILQASMTVRVTLYCFKLKFNKQLIIIWIILNLVITRLVTCRMQNATASNNASERNAYASSY